MLHQEKWFPSSSSTGFKLVVLEMVRDWLGREQPGIWRGHRAQLPAKASTMIVSLFRIEQLSLDAANGMDPKARLTPVEQVFPEAAEGPTGVNREQG